MSVENGGIPKSQFFWDSYSLMYFLIKRLTYIRILFSPMLIRIKTIPGLVTMTKAHKLYDFCLEGVCIAIKHMLAVRRVTFLNEQTKIYIC